MLKRVRFSSKKLLLRDKCGVLEKYLKTTKICIAEKLHIMKPYQLSGKDPGEISKPLFGSPTHD